MEQSRFSNRLFQIRLLVFEICETLIFLALVLALAAYSLIHIYQFAMLTLSPPERNVHAATTIPAANPPPVLDNISPSLEVDTWPDPSAWRDSTRSPHSCVSSCPRRLGTDSLNDGTRRGE